MSFNFNDVKDRGVYYNDFNRGASRWLRKLVSRGLLPRGTVDSRSILHVKAEELANFRQCHFFAGIGGWPYALNTLLVLDPKLRIWTGSPPCQPFSEIGAGLGKDDPRHLAPHFASLIQKGKPDYVFGEQVACKDVFGPATEELEHHNSGSAEPEWCWYDDLSTRMEDAGYSIAASDLPAACVGAPNIRSRAFFGAARTSRLVNAASQRQRASAQVYNGLSRDSPEWNQNHAQTGGCSLLGNAKPRAADIEQPWRDPHWLLGPDQAWRPIEPGTLPVDNGLSKTVELHHGYGNAINPHVAAHFVLSFFKAIEEIKCHRQTS